jgi:hypothetical protein
MTLAIEKSCNVRFCYEPFLSDRKIWFPKEELFKPSDLSNLMKNPDYDGIKHLSHQLDINANIKLLNNESVKYSIFLYRESFIDTILSMHMSMNFLKKTKKHKWHSWTNNDDFFSVIRDEVNLSYLQHRFNNLQSMKDYFFSSHNFSRIVKYEDFFSSNVKSNFLELIDEMGLKIFNEEYNQYLGKDSKLNDYEKYKKLIPNFDELIKVKDDFFLN